MTCINPLLRATLLATLLAMLPGCIISERIPSWPQTATNQLDLSDAEGLIVAASINGQPVRLRVETGYSGIILNPDAARRIALHPSIFRPEIRVGRTRVRGNSRVARLVTGAASDERRILWFERDIAAGADGIINIADLPFERVTLHLAPADPRDQALDFQTSPDDFWNLTYEHPLGDRRLRVRFRLDLPQGLITAAGGALLAESQSGIWSAEPTEALIGLGVPRPVRAMTFARPLSLNGLLVNHMLVRTSDFLGRYALPEDQTEDPDPDEVVITGRADRGEARLNAFIGRDQLRNCGRISYSRATRILTLHCRPAPDAFDAGIAAALQRSWLSLLPRRLIPATILFESRSAWQATQVRTPGRASRRRSGMSSPQTSQYSALSPAGRAALAPLMASATVSSICCSTAPSRAQPPAMAHS